MSGVIQTGHGVNSASLSDLPHQNNGILVTVIATAGVDLSRGVSLVDNQGNSLSRIALFEMWDMAAGHQSLAISYYGLLGLSSAPKGTYTINARGLPTGPNGGAAELALFEVNGLQSLDQIGSNGSPTATNPVATGTACSAINTSAYDLVIAALGVPDTVWTNAPRDPPGTGYTSVVSEVITPSGGGIFGAVQAAYKVVRASETSVADWGSIAIGAGNAWPWVSAVASFSLSDAAPRTQLRHLPPTGVAAVAPLAWIIERRRRRSLERVRRAAGIATAVGETPAAACEPQD